MRDDTHLTRPRSSDTTEAEHFVFTSTGSEKKQLAFDLERTRRETPGCRDTLHFNNAGASLMPQPVTEATITHLRLEA